MICNLFQEPIYFLFTSGVPTLLYYSYIPITVVVLLVGLYVFLANKNSLLNRLFLAISLLFSFWTASVLIEWTNIHSDLVLFVWNFQGIIFGLTAILCIYFIYVFLNKKDVSTRLKIIFLGLLAPIFILTPTYYLSGFNITTCDAFEFQSTIFQIYYIALGILAILWVLALLIRGYRISEVDFKKQISLMGTGILSFLFLFFIWTNLTYYLSEIGALPDSQLEMYGMFGILIFIVYIGILMVRFKAFNAKVIGANLLFLALLAVTASILFIADISTIRIVVSGSLIVMVIFGYMFINSVRSEVRQRETIEKQEKELEIANKKLEAFDVLKSKFLSLASHQLRSPITVIKSYTSMFLEGEYGEISELQRNTLTQMFQRAQDMNDDVEKYLTVAKIDQGGLQYNLKNMDLADFAKNMTEGLKIIATKKGLTLSFETDENPPYLINGDNIQLKQVVQNLIDNAMKFTKEGWIKVKLSKDQTAKKIRLAVSDSGRGIKPEIIPTLFKEFSRGDGSEVDAGGSGIGIYLAKEIIEKGHGGKIWVESEGDGKGATFIVELPVVLSK